MGLPVHRGRTYFERIYDKPPGSDVLISIWNRDLINTQLGLVWKAYDSLHTTTWLKVDWTQNYDDLERSLTEDLEQAIRAYSDSYSPIDIQHGSFERESRADPPAQPPQYDIAFKLRSDPRLMWPLEAKVLKSDRNTNDNLKDYIETLQERYLTGYYAPFSNGGAMIGYLKSGDAEVIITNISKRLNCTLLQYEQFSSRCHKTSDHQRNVPIDKDYPIEFRCHHLILPLN
jgi:hypothetical protein